MSLESANLPRDLDASLPSATDVLVEGDDHIRLIKHVLRATFPNLDAAITATAAQLNFPVPTLGVIAYGGSSAPAGWCLCDGGTYNKLDGSGTVVAPDLRDRFIIGASANTALASTGGSKAISGTTAAAGGHTHTGSTAAAGGHDHGGVTGGHALTGDENGPHIHQTTFLLSTPSSIGLYGPSASGAAMATQGTSSSGSGTPHTHPIPAQPDHAHALALDPAADHTHGIAIADGRPPFYALTYIMKL
uniref:tail fiber protein n=1 Tax=Methylobacterium sp. B34 TaxID=95563 RepID=UPI000345D1A3|nr:tail fiber protein [Methylobacterium sp. B34]